jgi:hypothetical protein
MKNIFVLPTDKPSRLYEFGGEYHLQIKSQENFRSQHINITSDEKPKEGDWVITPTNDIIQWAKVFQPIGKKIILTTDPKLIADGVQAIDDEFLEWFVKNPSCESVKVERLDTFKKTNEVYVDEIAGGNYYEIIKQYKIIIPQEELKQEFPQLGTKEFNNLASAYFGGKPQEELKTSYQWQLTYPDPVVMDPDGWDRKNYQYSWFEEKITLVEYNRRMLMSTCVIFTPQEETKPEGYICPHTKLQCDDECCVSTKDCHIKASLGILSEPKDEELSRIASTAPEPGGKDGWVKQFKNK